MRRPLCLTSVGTTADCRMIEIETVLMPMTFNADARGAISRRGAGADRRQRRCSAAPSRSKGWSLRTSFAKATAS